MSRSARVARPGPPSSASRRRRRGSARAKGEAASPVQEAYSLAAEQLLARASVASTTSSRAPSPAGRERSETASPPELPPDHRSRTDRLDGSSIGSRSRRAASSAWIVGGMRRCPRRPRSRRRAPASAPRRADCPPSGPPAVPLIVAERAVAVEVVDQRDRVGIGQSAPARTALETRLRRPATPGAAPRTPHGRGRRTGAGRRASARAGTRSGRAAALGPVHVLEHHQQGRAAARASKKRRTAHLGSSARLDRLRETGDLEHVLRDRGGVLVLREQPPIQRPRIGLARRKLRARSRRAAGRPRPRHRAGSFQ